MNHCACIRPLADALLAVSLVFSLWLPTAAAEDAAYGRSIFTYEFEVGKGVMPGGDGLGPVYNHRSCVGCHSQGGVGGGGPLDVNVQLLAARRAEVIELDDSDSEMPSPSGSSNQMCQTGSNQDFRGALKSIHPGFVSSQSQIVPNILLHRFGVDERYAEFRAALGGLDVPLTATASDRSGLAKGLNASPVETVSLNSTLHVRSLQRNTPALFGAGLIDEIPDATLHVEAQLQATAGVVSGRVPPLGPDRVGRFGWRGQTEHLSDFVRAACANELGLEVPGQSQPRDPFKPKARAVRVDLTQKHCDALTAYVASLPRPEYIAPEAPAERRTAERGRKLLASVGCTACHKQSLDGLDEIYSDQLLHDLGPELADPIAAEFALVLVKREDLKPAELNRFQAQPAGRSTAPQAPSNPYGQGGSLTTLAEDLNTPVTLVDVKSRTRSQFKREFSHVDREWKTPPLWGVADSAPYMHDGRAATLNEAISLHGGEAQNSKEQYFAMPDEDRQAVVAFLKCLRAPK